MPFLIRPPPDSAAANNPSLTYTLLEPDQNERSMLRDLRDWGWRISRHDFSDEEFIAALTQVEKDKRKRRRHTHALGDDLFGYVERPELEDVWHEEAQRKYAERLWEEEGEERGDREEGGKEMYVSALVTFFTTIHILTLRQ